MKLVLLSSDGHVTDLASGVWFYVILIVVGLVVALPLWTVPLLGWMTKRERSGAMPNSGYSRRTRVVAGLCTAVAVWTFVAATCVILCLVKVGTISDQTGGLLYVLLLFGYAGVATATADGFMDFWPKRPKPEASS